MREWGEDEDDPDDVTEFPAAPHPDGVSLRVTQDGFPAGAESDAFLVGCAQGWRDTLAGIRRVLTEASGSQGPT